MDPLALQYSFNVIYRRKHDQDGELSLKFCEYLVRHLEREGLNGYYADRDAMIGSNVFDEAFKVIKSSRFTIVVLSPQFVLDSWNLYWQQAAFRILAEQGHDGSRQFLPIALPGVDEATLARRCTNLCVNEVLYLPTNYERDTRGAWARKIIAAVKRGVPVSQLQGSLQVVVPRHPDGEGTSGRDMQNGACAGIGRDQSPPTLTSGQTSQRSIATVRPLPATVQGPPSGNPLGSTPRSSVQQVRGPGGQLFASQSSLEADSPCELDSLNSAPVVSLYADSYSSERLSTSSPIFVDLPDTVAHGDDTDQTIPKSAMYTISDSPPQTRISATDIGTENDDNLEYEVTSDSFNPTVHLSGVEPQSTVISQRPVENITDREEFVDHTRAETAVKQPVPLADMFEPLAGPVDSPKETDRGEAIGLPMVSPEGDLSVSRDPPADATTEHHRPVENASATDRDGHSSDSRAATAVKLLDPPAALLGPPAALLDDPTEDDHQEITPVVSLRTTPSMEATPNDYHPVGNATDHDDQPEARDTIVATATVSVTATHCQPSWYGRPTWRGLKDAVPFVALKVVESVWGRI